jgi:twinkle protein
MTTRTLGPFAVKVLEQRGLNPENAARLGIYTAKRGEAEGEIVPDEWGKILVFPFIERGVIVDEQYRAAGKQIWQMAGGRKTFWNADALDDPALAEGRMPLIITEGMFDAHAAIDCGFPLAVSVPQGGMPVPKGQKPDELPPIDEKDEPTGKFEFLWNNRDRLKPIKRFVLAVDNDPPGQRLAAELVRRLSASRCLFVTYPEDCKDLNDVLQKHGPEAVTRCLNEAQPYPVKGLYTLDKYPDAPAIVTLSTGFEMIDRDGLLKLFTPSLTTVIGIPGHGKSTWLSNLCCNAAEQHGWKSAVFSPEMPVVPHLRDKFRRIAGRRTIKRLASDGVLANVDDWISRHIIFIDHDDMDDEDLSLEWVLDRAADAVLRYGIRILVIDPWNEIEHARRRDETTADYCQRALREIKRFNRRYDLATFLVVHPTKEVGKDGKKRVPTLYDADGSSAFFNKSDFGICVDRPDSQVAETDIHIQKVRFEGTGTKGNVRMFFDVETSRFERLDFKVRPTLDFGDLEPISA